MRHFFVFLVVLGLLGTAVLAMSGQFSLRDTANARSERRWKEEDEKLIAEQYPEAKKTDSGLMYIVRKEGAGPVAPFASRVTVHYEGRFLDGQKFDSSFDRKEPFTFTLGVGKVIKGWDEAFATMKKGEKRTLIVPHWLGYGDKARPSIPPRSTLVFDVELISFQ